MSFHPGNPGLIGSCTWGSEMPWCATNYRCEISLQNRTSPTLWIICVTHWLFYQFLPCWIKTHPVKKTFRSHFHFQTTRLFVVALFAAAVLLALPFVTKFAL